MLVDPNQSCFVDNATAIPTERVVRVRVSALRPQKRRRSSGGDVSHYLFSLTVTRPGRGSASTNVVISTQSTATLK